MRRFVMIWAVVAAFGLGGCGDDEETEPAASETPVPEPAPVTPVEVATPEAEGEGTSAEGAAEAPATEGEAPAEGDELAQLRARVEELEAELASCRGEPLPEGVDAPAAAEGATAQAATPDEEGDGAGAASGRRGRRDPSLLGTILGDDGQPRRRRDENGEVLEVPNPAAILLGN